MLENPQLQEREMIQSSESGLKQMIGNPIKLSNAKSRATDPSPKHGEHTEEILEELADKKQV